jgi:hypothetical protein
MILEINFKPDHRLSIAVTFVPNLLGDIAPQVHVFIQLRFNTGFQFTNIACSRDFYRHAIQACGEVLGIVDPVRLDKRLKRPVLTIIQLGIVSFDKEPAPRRV